MITGNDSWKVLVICIIVSLIMCACGGITMAGYKSIFVGLANIALCLVVDYAVYKFFKSREAKK